MTTTRRIRGALAALTLAGTAVLGTTGTTGVAHAAAPTLEDSHANRTSLYAVSFSTTVNDTPGDAYCTQLTARIYDANQNQIGSEVSYGSVCSGRSFRFSSQSISTAQNRPITFVMLTARQGAGGEPVYVWARNF
ncbi:hypothetical protein [Nocardioides sp. cx-173]|uniref:hypothetical protein n=1 Tax=Nocardioides sp. cx-173 TaxID=2898796 RepID=UPI001E3D860F|nr:hypothetical protein [Nocardioides sp. cx-173]MCD4525259.1 hypothetical protein [Nocardioides sp. cx-173]UGB40939.1 hypothetical protein LQ940_16370 [Nocardioides sp. cx-173]